MAVNKVVYGDETLVDLTEDTVTAETLAKGVTAHDAAGVAIEGTYEEAIQHIKVNGTEQEIVDQTVDLAVPTKASELENDVPYATQADLTEVNAIAEQAQSTADSAASAAATAQNAAEAAQSTAEAAEAEAADLRKLVEDLEERVAELERYRYYFAVYSADDKSLMFYGDDALPAQNGQYNGKTVTVLYQEVESLGEEGWPWEQCGSINSITITPSFARAKPMHINTWFRYFYDTLETIGGLEFLNTSNVTDMSYMFQESEYLTTLNVSNWDTSNVTNMRGMFIGLFELTTLDIGSWDTSSVTSMSSMFRGCSGLTSLDVSGFDTSSVTDMSSMFYGCSGLTSLDVSGFDTSSVTDMSSMFRGCSGLTTIYSNDSNFVTTKVTSGASMFTSCSKLVGGNGTKYSSSNVTHTMAHIDTADNPGYFTDVADKP